MNNVNVSGPIQPTATYKTKVLKGNHSFASQVTEPNMKYVIKHDFVLDGDVAIPENCVLEFDGGSLNGKHTITFNKTELISPKFANATFAGTIKNYSVSAIGMGLDNTGSYDNSDVLLSLLLILPWTGTELIFEAGTYNINKRITIPDTQASFYLTGSGYQRTIIKATSTNAGITFTNLLRSTIKELRFNAGSYKRTTPFINVDNGVGVINVTTFHQCSFIGNKAFYSKFGGYCRFDECTAAIWESLSTDEWCIKLKGEYYYLNNCYFGGATFVENNTPSFLVINSVHVYIQNCDFCNIINGNAIELLGTCRYVNIDTTTFMRDTYLIKVDNSISVNNINVNADVYDERYIDKFVYFVSSSTGICWNLNFIFKVYGNFKDFDSFSGNVVSVPTRNCKVVFVCDNTAIRFPIPDNQNIYFIYPFNENIQGTSDPQTGIGEVVLLSNSPYNDLTVPVLVGCVDQQWSGIVNAHFENTFGGDFKLVFENYSHGGASKFRLLMEQKPNSI